MFFEGNQTLLVEYTFMQKHNSANNFSEKPGLVLLAKEKLQSSGLLIGRRQGLAVVVMVALVVCAALVLNKMSQPKPVVVLKAGDARGSGNESASNTGSVRKASTKSAVATEETKPAKQVFVHVAGAVVRPGVYQLKEGSRVIDGIAMAGGALPESDQDALNLAAPVLDGQKVYVPKKGQPAPAAQLGAGPAEVGSYGVAGVEPAAGSPAADKINLNLATPEQLDTLPGVGPVTAGKIIEYRNKIGAFKRVDELKEIDGIGTKKFEQLKDKLCVR